MSKGYRYLGIVFCAGIMLAAGHSLIARQNSPETAADSSISFLTLVPARTDGEIQRDLEAAQELRTAAIQAERTAQDQRNDLTMKIEDKKQAIAVNKENQKSAKQEKNESQMALLKAEEKSLDRDKNLLEEQLELRDAEVNLARTRNELAMLTKQALEMERQLAAKRSEQSSPGAGAADTARSARYLVDLEKATLEAQGKVADKQGDVAGALKKVLDRQMKTLEAQQSIYGGK